MSCRPVISTPCKPTLNFAAIERPVFYSTFYTPEPENHSTLVIAPSSLGLKSGLRLLAAELATWTRHKLSHLPMVGKFFATPQSAWDTLYYLA